MLTDERAFRLRLNPLQHLLSHGKIELALYLPFGALMVWIGGYLLGVDDPTLHSDRYGDLPTPVIAWGCLALGLFLLVGGPALVAMQARHSVVLAADRDGIFIRPNLDKKRTLHLSWDEVEAVYLRRFRFGSYICVKPKSLARDQEFAISAQVKVGGSAALGQRIAQKRRWKRLQTNIIVPIGGAADTPAEILSALRYQAAGRAPVETGNPLSR
ncbi:MAG TPA: hypothetical protein DGT23_13400 [Micromonosporaceae bacterium]|nr:hypothetical protein [Micromonosporaceae bacterium]